MKVAALISGGKDSVYAILKEIEKGDEVTCLISILPDNEESYMFHAYNTRFVSLISESMGIPLITRKSNGVKEEELKDLKIAVTYALKKYEFEGIVSGTIESNYQRDRLEDIFKDMRIELILPLWKKDPELLLRDMYRVMDIIIVHVSALGLDQSFLGKKIDDDLFSMLKELNTKYRVHICGEGGEYETFVIDTTLFNKRIDITDGIIKWNGSYGTFIIKNARLVEKR